MRVSVNAHLSFGMVNVPVGVSPSTSKASEVSFKTLHAPCLAPIKQDKLCSSCGKEHLGPEDLLKGYEVVKGSYVTFTEAELARLLPERSPIIKIETFMSTVDLSHQFGFPMINSATASYWLVPNEAFLPPYAVLVDAITESKLVGVGTCCLWGKDQLCAILVSGQALSLQLLVPPRSMVTPDFVVPVAPKDATAMAVELLKSMKSRKLTLNEIAPSNDELKKVIQAKVAGTEIAVEPVVAPDTTVDLMAALRASIAENAIKEPKKARKQVAA